MSPIRESVEELADRLALAVSELVTQRIISTVSESIRTADVPTQTTHPAPTLVTNGHKRGRKPVPPELKRLCQRQDGAPVLAKGLCRKHYYQMRRNLKAKEALKNGGSASAPIT